MAGNDDLKSIRNQVGETASNSQAAAASAAKALKVARQACDAAERSEKAAGRAADAAERIEKKMGGIVTFLEGSDLIARLTVRVAQWISAVGIIAVAVYTAFVAISHFDKVIAFVSNLIHGGAGK